LKVVSRISGILRLTTRDTFNKTYWAAFSHYYLCYLYNSKLFRISNIKN